MSTHKSSAVWKGNLMHGQGTMNVGQGAWESAFSAKSRFEGGKGSSPEELIAAAHAGCFSMAFSHELAEAGYEPIKVETTADVTIEKTKDGFTITKIHLTTKGEVKGIKKEEFMKIANAAKEGCPVSKALKAVPSITLDATLK